MHKIILMINRDAYAPQIGPVSCQLHNTQFPTNSRLQIGCPTQARKHTQHLHCMDIHTRNILASLIELQVQFQRKTEDRRQLLVGNHQFDPLLLFKYLDSANKGYLTDADLLDFLRLSQAMATSNDVYLVMRSLFGSAATHFNRITDIALSESIMPRHFQPLKNLANSIKKTIESPGSIKPKRLITADIQLALAKLLQQEVQNCRAIEKYRQELSLSRNFDISICFSCIDKNKKGYISEVDIDAFLRDHLRYLNAQEIKVAFRVLDRNKDLKIDIQDFIDSILPWSQEPQQGNISLTLLESPLKKKPSISLSLGCDSPAKIKQSAYSTIQSRTSMNGRGQENMPQSMPRIGILAASIYGETQLQADINQMRNSLIVFNESRRERILNDLKRSKLENQVTGGLMSSPTKIRVSHVESNIKGSSRRGDQESSPIRQLIQQESSSNALEGGIKPQYISKSRYEETRDTRMTQRTVL